MWVNADEWLGPKPAAGIDLFDARPDVRCPDLRERASKPLVVAYERAI
jgi:hypothetical protein